jgi:hypothetical protein
VIGMPLVADVVEPAKVRAVACDDSITPRCGELATELCLAPRALLRGPVTEFLMHGGKRIPSAHAGSRHEWFTLLVSERVAVASWRKSDSLGATT